MHVIGEDAAERLDVIPAQFRVIVTHRPKYACRACEEAVVQAPPPRLSVDFLGDLDGVVNLDAKVAEGVFDLRVAEQQLDGPKVAGTSVDQCRLGSSQRVRTELQRIETDTCDPLADQPCVLPRRQAAIAPASPGEQELPSAPARNTKMLVDSLTRLLGQLEPYRAPGFLLGTVARATA